MGFALPSVSAVDRDCSLNDTQCVRDHGRLYEPTKRNSQLEVPRLQNFTRPYYQWNQDIRAYAHHRGNTRIVTIVPGWLARSYQVDPWGDSNAAPQPGA